MEQDIQKYARHIITGSVSIADALRRINSLSGSGVMTLIVIDDTDGCPRVVGTLTDGDVRRALIAGTELSAPVSCAMQRRFSWIDADADSQQKIQSIKDMRSRGIQLIPVLDADMRLHGLLDLKRTRSVLPIRAVLMAGGKGERLRPLTLTTPKPLLKIDGKAIIDYNVESLARCGVTDITVTTRYLAEQIVDHFSRPVAGVQVKCVTEDAPLGTIGSVSLIEKKERGATLLMNSDLLTTISFEDMYLRHVHEQALITVAVIPYQVSVPFAILTTDGNAVTGIEEKPTYSYFANAGIYIIDNAVLATVPGDARTDATDLVESVINTGGKVVYHPIDGTWLDVGSPADFAQASELMRHHRNLSHTD